MAKKYDMIDWKLAWKAFDVLCEVVEDSWRAGGRYRATDWEHQSPQLRHVLTTLGVKINGIQWRRFDRKFAEWYDASCEYKTWYKQKKWIQEYISAGVF